MARFKNSNRQATRQMAYTASRGSRHGGKYKPEPAYFQRIGFDFAMI
ncbi:hypothetical protein AAFO92_18405 [Roseovarius sp. CAU 1744]